MYEWTQEADAARFVRTYADSTGERQRATLSGTAEDYTVQ